MDVLKSILNEEEKKEFEEKTLSRIKEDERLKEIAALPVTYDDDIPEFSDSDILMIK